MTGGEAGLHYHYGTARPIWQDATRERLQDERRGFADHCRVDATGDRVHALPEYLETRGPGKIRAPVI